MTIELLGFVYIMRALLAGAGAQWFLAASAYFSGKAAAMLATVFERAHVCLAAPE